MKKTLLIIILTIIAATGFAQIEPWYGIYEVDSCKFETPCHLIINDTVTGNLWQRGAPQKLVFTESYSLPNAMVTDTLNPYPANADAWFDLRFNMEEYFYGMDILVGFRHRYNTDTLADGGYIELSYDHGLTWVNILNDPNYMIFLSENLYGAGDTLTGGIPGFSGYSGDWVHTQIEIIYALPVKWPVDSLYMRFHFISDDVETARDGWIIDNIKSSFVDLGSAAKNNDITPIMVFPNPLTESSILTIPNSSGKILKIELIGTSGNSVRKFETDQSVLTIEKGTLKPGLYIIKVSSDNELKATGKIIVSE